MAGKWIATAGIPLCGLAALRVARRCLWRFVCYLAAYAAPKIGLASLITIGIAGQIVMALLLDHVGALGLPRDALSIGRIAGALLVVAGVILVRRS